jgi:hypothetical protein
VKIKGMGKGGRLNRKRREWRLEKGEWESGRGTSLNTVSFLYFSFDSFH